MGRKQEELNLSGVTIPTSIMHTSLSDAEKILLGKIDNLDSGGKGCYASLTSLARMSGNRSAKGLRKVNRIIQKMTARNLIETWTDPARPTYTYRRVNKKNLFAITHEDALFLDEINAGRNGNCITPPTSVKNDTGRNSQPVSKVAPNQCQKLYQPVSKIAPTSVKSGAPIRKSLQDQRENLKNKQNKDFVSLASPGGDLALKIKNRQEKFFEEIGKIFPPRTKSDRTTLARIALHLGKLIDEGDHGIIIFDQVVSWAGIASQQNVNNKRALFMSKVIEQTGYKSQKSLLTRGVV